MQQDKEKLNRIIKAFGKIIKNKRIAVPDKSLNIFSYENDLDPGNLSRIENGLIEPKLTMLWRISEALDIKLSELIKILEKELGNKFYLIEK